MLKSKRHPRDAFGKLTANPWYLRKAYRDRIALAALGIFLMFFYLRKSPEVHQPDIQQPIEKDLEQHQVETKAFDSIDVVEPQLKIITGTHALGDPIDLSTQDPICLQVAKSIHSLWTAWDTTTYSLNKRLLKDTLRELHESGASCTLNGEPDEGYVWSFPIAHAPDAECTDFAVTQALKKKPWIKTTKVFFPWFLLRPDLPTLLKMAKEQGIVVKYYISIGHDYTSASFTQESRCPRFNTVIGNHAIYKQRLLLAAVSDVLYQTTKMNKLRYELNICSRDVIDTDKQLGNLPAVVPWDVDPNGPPKCDARHGFVTPSSKTHLATITMMNKFLNFKLRKTYFKGPTLVFVAGLEGVGHHMFSALGRKQTYRFLYDALTDHLADSAWDERGEMRYASARAQLVEAMRQIKDPSRNLDVAFLNTVFSEQAVNMYSIPWGGPRCKLKRFARIMCNIDVVELARMAEEAEVDFRVVVLKRSIGAAVVSASLHRPYGTVTSETRMLSEAWALLRTGLSTIDKRFILEMDYENMMKHPEIAAKVLNKHIKVEPGSFLENQIQTEMANSAELYRQKQSEANDWETEVSVQDLELMKDLLQMDNL